MTSCMVGFLHIHLHTPCATISREFIANSFHDLSQPEVFTSPQFLQMTEGCWLFATGGIAKKFKNLLNTWNMVKYRIYSSWILASKSIFPSKENDWTTNPNRYLYNWDCFGSSSDSIPRQLGQQTRLLEMLRKWTIEIHLYPTKFTTKKIHIDQSCQLSIACWSGCKTNHEPCLLSAQKKGYSNQIHTELVCCLYPNNQLLLEKATFLTSSYGQKTNGSGFLSYRIMWRKGITKRSQCYADKLTKLA